jgi:CDGSH-type Zn-finger protein/uncharacterized Fe-S cluster protein YjdI
MQEHQRGKMSEKYTGQEMDRRYPGAEGDITYNIRRCIHAEHCVHRLGQVFDPKRRPWIDPNAAPPEQIKPVIPVCPSGATEPIPAGNTITLWANGPLQLYGNLQIEGAKVAIAGETRATLCRCGSSYNKPFCDNTHKEVGFMAADDGIGGIAPDLAQGGNLIVTATENGPLHVEGNFTIVNAAGETIAAGDDTWLCRCGASQNKPFCDGSHNEIGFQAE